MARTIRSGKDSLSERGRQAVQALNGSRPGRFALECLLAWTVIIGAIAGAVWIDRWYTTAAAILIVATRQNVLGLLVHDQTHASFGGRWGDWVANLFCAYPLLAITVEGYAQVHLAHHRDFFGSGDPDHDRKQGADWMLPMRGQRLVRLFLSDISGLNTLKMVRGKKAGARLAIKAARRGQVPRWLRPAFLACLVAGLTWWQAWPMFLLYWVLPLVTLMPAIVRWGALCEHEYNRPHASVLDATPVILQPWYERLLMPMLNFGAHAYHHLYPGVSFSQLPKVHAIFQSEGLVHESRVFRGSWDYLQFLLGRPHAAIDQRHPAVAADGSNS